MNTLAELRALYSEFITQAQAEQVPEKAAKIATLGESYPSNNHGTYQLFPMYYDSWVAVFARKDHIGQLLKYEKRGQTENHQIWEQCTSVSVRIMKRFDTTKLDPRESIPVFWNGHTVLYWILSDIRTEPLTTDLFVPGQWWTKAQEYLPKADTEMETAAKNSQEIERQNLHDKLLIDISV